jgi:uncharacterized protein YegP (UPF0339 family)
MSYKIGVQKTTTGQFRVVLYSANGKLVLAGEPVKNRQDADDTVCDILDASLEDSITAADKLIPATKKWPKNSGPKKYRATKKTK